MNHMAALGAALAVLSGVLLRQAEAAGEADPAALVERAMAVAEASLREGEFQVAESHYRDALRDAWLLTGTLARVEGRPLEARDAFRRASTSAVDDALALKALALADLQLGETAPAVEILTRLAGKDPKDIQTRRLLAQALGAAGQSERAVRELAGLRASAPDDIELAFALAAGYLGAKRPDDAQRLFAQIALDRPIPQTRILIALTYRDFGEYGKAAAQLRMALKQDARVRRAHYWLGKLIAAEKGRGGLEEAIPEFQAELVLAPQDPLANLELGMALLELQRPEEALPALAIAVRTGPPRASTFYYLGRSQLGVGRASEAVASLKRALALVEKEGAPTLEQLRAIHNQLGQALRQSGEAEEAAIHFAAGERMTAEGTVATREKWARQVAGTPDPEADARPGLPVIEASPVAELPPSERLALERRVKEALARTYFNLGVMQAQRGRFVVAGEQFEQAAGVDPEFPQVQSSLGIAYFNARKFDKATAPLGRALAATPTDAGVRRMLAMAWLNTREYEKAAELFGQDPEIGKDASLQFAYGLALAKSGRAPQAQEVFSRLLATHGDSTELSVLLGKAYAQMGDFDSAVEYLQKALRSRPDAAEANGALGVIFLKQGRMAEAEASLRAELARNPTDLQSQQNLAYVLDAEQRPEEALPLLRAVLRAKPDFAEARYLLGKILLAQGSTAEAIEHLEAAARLAPGEANNHYQLGRAYTRAGRVDEAQQQFEISRQIKARR
jgi:tetratricopeptide (TPR) repeat protein